ncbi:T9SS type A sorting domain-containing protein [Bacteroidota bacterium]
MQKILQNILKILAFLTIAFVQLNAQDDTLVFDSKGKDFWLAFPPNFHQSGAGYSDSIYVFIVAEEPTNGVIVYRNRNGIEKTEPFTINNPDEIYVFGLRYNDYEVYGYNIMSQIRDDNYSLNQSEKPGKNSFHILADNEVTVYAHSQARYTSDAYLILPTDVLGKEYLILSYTSDGDGYTDWWTNQWNESTSSTPSQFLIVASEDNTSITINPSDQLYRNGSGQLKLALNQGEVFLVQAKIRNGNLQPDLTGTEVISDKPIAVFSGHQRALVPVNTSLDSRDCLIEQLLPVPTWGRNAFVIPYAIPSDMNNNDGDIFRILVGLDDTEVFINGVSKGIYQKGEFIENRIYGPYTIEATGPILVAQYKGTSGYTGEQKNSDPFMMLVPPKEQFMKEYRVLNTQAYEGSGGGGSDKIYNEHYISVVIPKVAINNIVLDGLFIDQNYFQSIPNTDYFYANLGVKEGVHSVKSDYKFGIYIYGYGGANSYGYTGGLSMAQFDYKKPQIQAKDSCYLIEGIAFATNKTVNKIKIVDAPEEKKENVDVFIEPFQPYRDSVYFEATLQNRFLDGSFEIFAEDSVGQDSTMFYQIPGFTVSIDSIMEDDVIVVIQKNLRTSTDYCDYFDLVNYGRFTHEITDISLKNGSDISIKLEAPFMIRSKEILPLELCFRFDKDTIITDTIIISDDCGTRSMIAIKLEFLSDKNEPDITIISDSCKNSFNIIIDEPSVFDWGIKAVNIDEVMNCKVLQISRNTKQEVYVIDIVDPYKDAIFIITAEDSAGNTRTITDTIQGFTIEMPQFENNKNLIDYNFEKIGNIDCEKLELANSGILPFIIDNIFLKNNVTFSIPQIQFPLIINPDGQENIEICFHPYDTYDIFRDTLVIVHNCLSMDIELQGLGDALIYYGESDCKVRIKTIAHSINPEYYLEQNSPNPVLTTTGFSFGLPDKGKVNLSLFDLLGNNRITVLDDVLEKGSYRIEASLDDLPQGIYFYFLNSKTGRISGTLIKE